MQKYIEGTNRHQSYFSTLEDQVSSDNAVGLIDAFIDKMDLEKLNSEKSYIKRRPSAICPAGTFKTVFIWVSQ